MVLARPHRAPESANHTKRDYLYLCGYLWSNFGAGQGWFGARKRNQSNDLARIHACLEGRHSLLNYGGS